MRNLLTSGLAVLMLTACGQGDDGSVAPDASTPAADASAPVAGSAAPEGPTPGLWRVTTRMPGMPAGMEPPAVETCIRESTFQPPQGGAEGEAMNCDKPVFRREGGAMTGRMVCTSPAGERTATDMRVTGDLSRRYTMEMTTATTPASGSEAAAMTMVMTAERLGDCPAGSAAQ